MEIRQIGHLPDVLMFDGLIGDGQVGAVFTVGSQVFARSKEKLALEKLVYLRSSC